MSISVQFCAISTGSNNKGTQIYIGILGLCKALLFITRLQCALQTFYPYFLRTLLYVCLYSTFYDLLSLFSKNFTLRLSGGFDHVLLASDDVEYTSYLVNSVPMDNYIFF